MLKKIFSVIYLLIATMYITHAQTWRWGKSGGSGSSGSGGADETVVDMTTDHNGNIYILSDVYELGLNIDGHPRTGYGYRDVLIASFTCDGVYRWSKLIGGASQDNSIALKTDTLDGVYVICTTVFDIITGGQIDADAIITTTQKMNLLVKYDTAGTYQWHRYPQSDSVTNFSALNTRFIDMDVDMDGNSYTLCKLAPGAYAGGSFVVPSQGNYIIKYDRNGNFISGTLMDITSAGNGESSLKLKRDHGNGNYIISGTMLYSVGTMSIGSTPITHPMLVAYFDNNGNLVWLKQDTDDLLYGSQFGRAAVDASHNIYLGGRASLIDTFNGYAMTNAANNSAPFVMVMDQGGSMLWARNATVNAATFCQNIVLNGNEVMIAGQYPGKLKWLGFTDSLSLAVNTIYDVFITRFNKNTGAVVAIDSLASDFGALEDATAMTADRKGNVYVGGNFRSQIMIAGTTLNSIGGGSDFFVGKYGYNNCNCINPTASFTSVGTHSVTFTYTGTTGYDSVRWDFGDGGTSTLGSPTHTFATAGTYTVCVTTYTSCGSDMHCQSFTATGGTTALGTAVIADVDVYPNPVQEQLAIENINAGTVIRVLDMMGREVYGAIAAAGNASIDMRSLATGSYLLQLTDPGGHRVNKMIVKR